MNGKTHIYMANLIADEIKKFGKLTLPGIGSYKPPDDVIDAINSYPAAFRAGAVGPDCYPDMLFGQTVIHSENSGEWITRLFKEYGRLPSNYPDKKKCYAFVLGFMMHYAGDMYGHHYVNNWAKGWWEYSDDDKKMKIIARHVLIERYMDQKVPENIDAELDAPLVFLKDCFLSTSLKAEYAKAPVKMPLDALFELEKASIDFKNRNDIGTFYDEGYCQGWVEDIRRASNEWLLAWQKVVHILSDDSHSVKEVKEVLELWVNNNLLLIVGVPKWADKIIEKFRAVIDVLNILKPLKEQIEKVIFHYISLFIFSITNKQVKDLDEALIILEQILTEPALYLNSGILYPEYYVSVKLYTEMGNYGASNDTLIQSFHAVYQSLNMCKLCLIGPGNLNIVARKDISYCLRIMIKTAGNINFPIFNGMFNGTDDDVYFALIMSDGKIFETILKNKDHDDFKNGQIDSFDFSLPLDIDLSRVVRLRLRKDHKVISDDWKLEWIELYDNNGKRIFHAAINKVLKGREEYFIDAKLVLGENNVQTVKNYELNRKYAIRLKAFNLQYVCTEGGGGGAVVANRQNADIWETFGIKYKNEGLLMSGDEINLFSYNGSYLCAEGGGGREVVANRSTPAEWESFIIQNVQGSGEIKNGDKVTLRYYNGMYVCAENGGGSELVANRQRADIWETFTVEFVDPAEGLFKYSTPYYQRGVRHLRIEISTSDKIFSGTDDNVYFAVIMWDGRVFEIRLDKANYNDFERNDTDSYTFDLPQTIMLNDIAKFRLRKDYMSISDDWRPRWIRLYDEANNMIFQKNIDEDIKDRNHFNMDANIAQQSNLVSIDPRIISFLYSLDGKGLGKENPTSYLQWSAFPFYTHPVLRTTIYKKLFENTCVENLISIRLKAFNGQYVCAEGGGELVANRQNADTWETFIVRNQSEGKFVSGNIISLLSCNGNYVCAEGGGGGEIVVNRSIPAEWEGFVIQNVQGSGEIKNGDKVTLRCYNGMYACAENGGGSKLVANRQKADVWETFTIEIVDTIIPPSTRGSDISKLSSWVGFEYDEVQGIFYSKIHPWQRKFGYFPVYDTSAPLVDIYIQYEKICFKDRGKCWKIELWKGQYGISTGAEIGIYVGEFQVDTKYNTFDDRINAIMHFQDNTECAKDVNMLQMAFELRKNGNYVFNRDSNNPATAESEKHWWLTGFKPGVFSRASELSMKITIVLKDPPMLIAFKRELYKMGYRDITTDKNTNTVTFEFKQPKTPQTWPFL